MLYLVAMTHILTDVLTFSTFEFKNVFYFRRQRVDLKLNLDENCANTGQLFTGNHFRKRVLMISPLLVRVEEKFNSKIFLISKSILGGWGKQKSFLTEKMASWVEIHFFLNL